jgi:polyhydroxybutyrate depolymerase
VEAAGAVTHETLAVGGRQRTYRFYVPARLPDGPVPLLVGLHGGTGWGDQFAAATGVEGWAEANGFIVVHPDGVPVGRTRGGVWNGGVCCGVAAREGVDDVAFIAALLDRLAQEHDIDESRIFAFGHSNGGIMSYRLACELGDRIAAVGVVAGTLGVDACDPAQPVSVLHIHGTADENLPITGGIGARSVAGVDFPSPVDGFGRVAGAVGCPDPETATDGDVTTAIRAPCEGGATATFVTIAGAQHPWPGTTARTAPGAGQPYAGYDATAEIVAFLLAHPRT